VVGIKKKPNCYEGLYWKAVALMSLKQQDQLTQWIDKALANDPFHIQFLCNKGLALFDQQQYSEALQYFERVLSMDSNDLNAIINKAATLRKLKKYQKALIWCDKAIQLCDPHKHFFCFYEKYALLVEMKRYDDGSRLLDLIRKNFGEPLNQWEASQIEELAKLKKIELKKKKEMKEKKRSKRREKITERKKTMIKNQFDKKLTVQQSSDFIIFPPDCMSITSITSPEYPQKLNGIAILAMIFVGLTMLTILYCIHCISSED